MVHGEASGLVVGAVALGLVHGVDPGHGWPVAASYALDRSNKWLYGFAASAILGVGHLVSSIAMVGAFFYAKGYFDLAAVDERVTLFGDVQVGGPVSLVAGTLLIALGVREYRHGHTHGTPGTGVGDDADGPHGEDHDGDRSHDHGHHHPHTDGDDHHDRLHVDGDGRPNGDESEGLRARVVDALPFVGGRTHRQPADAAERGLLGIAWFAFLLGFAHEEEFEIIALCVGSSYCLELMGLYATAVVGIVGLTMLLLAGCCHYEDRVERLAPYLPAFSAAVLVVMGLGFITGLF